MADRPRSTHQSGQRGQVGNSDEQPELHANVLERARRRPEKPRAVGADEHIQLAVGLLRQSCFVMGFQRLFNAFEAVLTTFQRGDRG